MNINRRAQIELLRFLHKGKNDVGPLTQGHLLADQAVSLIPVGSRQEARADWRTPGR